MGRDRVPPPSVGAVGDRFLWRKGENSTPLGVFGVDLGWVRERGLHGEVSRVGLRGGGSCGPFGWGSVSWSSRVWLC